MIIKDKYKLHSRYFGNKIGQMKFLGGNELLIFSILVNLIPGGYVLSLIALVIMMARHLILDALLGVILITLANPVLFKVDSFNLTRWAVIFAFLLVSLPKLKVRSLSFSYFLIVFGAFLMWSCVFVSPFLTLSLFKSIIFLLVLWFLFNGRNLNWTLFSARMDFFIPIYVIITLPILLFPSIGKALNDLGFQGLTNQPQVLGIICSSFSAWLFSRLLANKISVYRWIAWLSLLGLLVILLESQARTALVSVIISFVVVWLVDFFNRSTSVWRSLIVAALSITFCLIIFNQTSVIQNFVFKERIGGVRENLNNNSRSQLIDNSLVNFSKHPYTGIGFGVPSRLSDSTYVYDPLFHFPISANAEKGVWISATFEELGVVGFSIYALVLLAIIVFAVKVKRYMGIAMLINVLISNLGEMTMFSMGALGIIQWILVFSLIFAESKSDTKLIIL